MSGDEDIDRRQLLKLAGMSIGLSGLAGASAPAGAESKTTPVEMERTVLDGEKRAEAVQAAVSELESSTVGNRVSNRGYSVDTDAATAVEVTIGDETMTNVRVPLTEAGQTLAEYPSGAASDADPTEATIASYQWSTADWWTERAVRTGQAEELLDDQTLAEAPLAPDDHVTELLTPDGETVTAHTIPEEKSLATAETMTKVVVDRETGAVTTTEISAEEAGAKGTCPTSLLVVVSEIAFCGAGCGECYGAGWTIVGLLYCLGCAACSCHLACCLGKLGGPTVCSIAWDIWTSPALVPPNVMIAAGCVVSGCYGGFC